jgi:hypothetical protein
VGVAADNAAIKLSSAEPGPSDRVPRDPGTNDGQNRYRLNIEKQKFKEKTSRKSQIASRFGASACPAILP